ncbi:MAG: iron-containing alcohol dehydrogenase [Thermoplasmata archaeon]|nr:iron-containing alcohol dehydrogenase [Thermoplasmata archaeon]
MIRRQDEDTLILLGPGLVDDLGQVLDGLGATRAYLVTGASLASGPVGDRVRDALGHRLVGEFGGSRPHVPSQTADEVTDEARKVSADVLVGLGGGSPIGTAKAAAAHLLETGRPCFVAAIPTTYAGSEVTAVFGTTDMEQGRKGVVRNPSIRPRLALYDPELALDTPPELTASTGVNALAHCVEGLYSKSADEAVRTMALRAARVLLAHLPRAVQDPRNLGHRYHLFEGSMEAGLVLAKAGMGVHHGLCHVLGGRYQAPHGVLNGIILPHAMRFNLPVAGMAYRDLAPAFGVRIGDAGDAELGERVCQATSDFVKLLGLPQRLRDLGIPKQDLPSVAEEALESKAVQANPRPLNGARDALAILEAAW